MSQENGRVGDAGYCTAGAIGPSMTYGCVTFGIAWLREGPAGGYI
jgi:hypothetical protein